MRRTVRYILATSNPMGDLEALEKFVRIAPDTGADAIALIGNLMPKTAKSRDYAAFFRILSEAHLPTAYIPGPEDAPIWEYLREAANVELVHPQMRNVHETFTFWRGPYLVAGVGGEITDEGEPEEEEALRYPAWVAEYHLKALWELKDYPKIFLFHTMPYHKGLGRRAPTRWPTSSRPTTPFSSSWPVRARSTRSSGRAGWWCPATSRRASTASWT